MHLREPSRPSQLASSLYSMDAQEISSMCTYANQVGLHSYEKAFSKEDIKWRISQCEDYKYIPVS